MNFLPYIVFAPDYLHRNAGRRVLHKLCHLLNQAGQSAYIYKSRTNRKWNTPRISGRKAKAMINQGAIVVYPEVTAGNPLKAKTVVRYILNNPGLLGGDKTYDPSEILFCFSKHLLQAGMSQERILAIPAIDTDIFYKDNRVERDIDYLVYFGKHALVPGYPKKNIIHTNWPKNPVQLGQMLRRCKKLVSYDNLTALNFEATLCGCPVVIMPDGFRKREDIESLEFGFNGMAWGNRPEEFAKAQATLDQAPVMLQKVTQKAEAELKNFITITQKAAQACKQ